MGSHEVKWDAMGFQGGMYWVPCGSRGASVGSHGVKGDVKGFPGGQVDVYSSEGSSPRVSRVTSGTDEQTGPPKAKVKRFSRT